MKDQNTQQPRGRSAETPGDIPPRGWWDITTRVAKRLGPDNVSLVSGGLAMYTLLSVFPALGALVSVYGLFTTPADVVRNMKSFAGVLPPGTWSIFNQQLHTLTQQNQSMLTTGAIIGVVLSLWSASSAMSALMSATNIAYAEREKRGFLWFTLLAILFTIGAVVGFILMLVLGVVVPAALETMGTSQPVKIVVAVVRFALLWALAVFGLAVIYRYAPARERARWQWVTLGSAIAATLWIIASALFAFYVRTFASYGKTYGAVGDFVVLLMWFYISGFIIVLGAEINAEAERQTRKDTTVRGGAPMGQRGAFAADTVGPAAGESAASERSEQPAVGRNNVSGK
jgi:membrane protein